MAAALDDSRSPHSTVGFLASKSGAVFCVATSAICYFLATRFIDWWPFALAAPLPMLAATFATPSRGRAWLCAFLPLFIGGFGEWAAAYFFLSTPAFVFVTALLALFVAGLAMVARVLARRWRNALAAFAFPILYAALNFILGRTLYDGTWGNPGYHVTTFVPLLQVASVAGLAGVVLAMTLPAAGLALAWYRAEADRPWQSAAGIPLAMFLAVLTFGEIRMLTMSHPLVLRVAMIASDHQMKYARTTDASHAAELMQFYAGLIPNAAKRGAQVLVLPEKIVGVTPEDRDVMTKILSAAASTSHLWVIAGVNELGPHHLNTAWIFSPDGALAGEYHKHYFVRGFEGGYESGDDIFTVDAPWGRSAVAICKDLDYPPFIRSYGERGATLMLVPAWDWTGPNADEHERMALVRGVENGFAMARSAKTGFLTAHDAYGRVLASGSTFASDPVMVVADIPLGPGPTLYTRFGDWFGWLCVVASLAMLFLLLRLDR